MVSFWPSLGLLLFFLVAFLKCRAIGARVTLPLGGFLPFFAYGAVGATLLSLLLEQLPFFQFPLVENSQLQLVAPAAWLSGPALEELAKALPIFVLAFAGTTSRRLTIADLTLAGFASGAGFGFVEANLQVAAGGAFPAFNWLSTDFDTVEQVASEYTICFAGHAVYTGLIALVAAASVRLLPLDRVYTWIPAAFAFLLVFFDHTMFNWKMLHPGLAIGGNFLEAPNTLESLYALTFHGRLETWLLPAGLIAAQIAEAWFCSRATGKRHDLLLPLEWRAWVINEWLVTLLRLRLGRAAVQHTLVYFRRRRAFALTTLETKRNPDDRTLAGHVRFLERRLNREQEFLVSPPAGTWFLPTSVLLSGGMNYAWRSRWVFTFAVLFIVLFMFGPNQLPQFLQPLLGDDTTTSVLIGLALGFTAWQGYRFWRAARPDAVVGESTSHALFQARMFVLGASLIGSLCPALALLLGWKAMVPGAAYISSYFSAWIAQGGNPYALMALASLGGAVDVDPAPTGQILREEMAAAGERIRRLERDFIERAAVALSRLDPSMVQASASAPGGIVGTMGRVLRHDGGGGTAFGLAGIIGSRSSTVQAQAAPFDRALGEFVDLMAKLDAHRDAQEQRKLLLDELERQAAETRGDDLSFAIQAVEEEFEGLAAELKIVADKELARMTAFEQAYSKAWAQTMRDLDAYDGARRAMKEPLQLFWQPEKDGAWAARVAAIDDERVLPLQAMLLPELEAFAAEATAERAENLQAAIERIRAAQPVAREHLETPSAEPQIAETSQFAAELGSGSPQDEIAADGAHDAGIQPAAEVLASDDTLAFESFGRKSQRISMAEEIDEAPAHSETTDAPAEFDQHEAPVQLDDENPAPAIAEIPAAIAPETTDEREELERLLDAIKRDSGYLATVKLSETPAPVAEESRQTPAEQNETELEQLRDAIRRESGYMEPAGDDADTNLLTDSHEGTDTEETVAALDADLFELQADDIVTTAATGQIDAEEDQGPSIASSETAALAEAPTEPTHTALTEHAEASFPQEPAAHETVELDVERADATTTISGEIVAVEAEQPPVEAEIAEEPGYQVTEHDAGGSENTPTDLSADAVALTAMADGTIPEEDIAAKPALQEVAQLETSSIETPSSPIFHIELRGKASMLDAYSMVAKATAPSAYVEELPVEDVVEPAGDNAETEIRIDFEVPPATVDHDENASFEEHLPVQDDAAGTDPVSAAGNGQDEETVVARKEGADGVAAAVVEKADAEEEDSHANRDTAEPESKILDTVKRFDVTDFVEAQLDYLGDHASIDEPRPVVQDPEPEPVVEHPKTEPTIDAEQTRADIPDPWNAEAGTLFALEPVPESNELIKFGPAAVESRHSEANGHEQMPLDFTTPAQSGTKLMSGDDASLPVEAEVQSAAPASMPEPTSEPVAADAFPVEDVRPEPEATTEKPAQTSLRAVIDEGKAPKDEGGLLRRVGGYFRAPRQKKSRSPSADLRKAVQEVVKSTPTPTDIVAETIRNKATVGEPAAAPAQTLTETTADAAVDLAPTQPENIVTTDIGTQKAEPERDAIHSSLDSLVSTTPEPAPAMEQIPQRGEDNEPPIQPVVAVADSTAGETQEPKDADAKSMARDAALGNLVEQLLAHIQKAGAAAPAEAAVTQQGSKASSLPTLVEQLRTQVQKLGDRPQDQAAEVPESNADPKQVREDSLANLVEQLRSEVLKSRETTVAAASLPEQQSSETKAPLGEISLPKLEDFLRTHLDAAEVPSRPAVPLPKPPRAPSPPAVDVHPREVKPVAGVAPPAKPARSARPANKARSKLVHENKLPVIESTPKPEKHLEAQKPGPPPPAASESTTKLERDVPVQKAVAPPPAASESTKLEKNVPVQKTVAPPPPATASVAKPEKEVRFGKAAPPPPAAGTPVRLVRDIGPRGSTKIDGDKKPPLREPENTGGMRPSKFFNPGQVRPDVEDVTALRKTAVEKRVSGSQLSEAVAEYYGKRKQPLPPMHTTDAANLRKIIDTGKLETPRKGPAPWSFSGVLRKGDVAIRLKPGAEKYVEFVASNETFGQVTRFYPRSVGVGAFKTFIPAEHLEYFDLTRLEWAPVKQ